MKPKTRITYPLWYVFLDYTKKDFDREMNEAIKYSEETNTLFYIRCTLSLFLAFNLFKQGKIVLVPVILKNKRWIHMEEVWVEKK